MSSHSSHRSVIDGIICYDLFVLMNVHLYVTIDWIIGVIDYIVAKW